MEVITVFAFCQYYKIPFSHNSLSEDSTQKNSTRWCAKFY